MAAFSSIFRFRAEEGGVHFGEAGESPNHTTESLTGRSVPVFGGDNPWDHDFRLTQERRTVAEVWISKWATWTIWWSLSVTDVLGDRSFVH